MEIISILKKHRVKKAYVFGSVCTEKFNKDSDVDFIVEFEQRFFDDYVDNFFSMEEKLKALLDRDVDIIAKETIKNPYFLKVVNKTKTSIL